VIQRRNILSIWILKKKALSQQDAAVGKDLVDTLLANADACVGMAANMIGVHKRIIVFDAGDGPVLMYNPVITKKAGEYQTEEGCLSLSGVRPTKRWKRIKVEYLNEDFRPRCKTFTEWAAQIIQHEIDHCDGILI
jgi:peptide deformylase